MSQITSVLIYFDKEVFTAFKLKKVSNLIQGSQLVSKYVSVRD